MIGDAFLRRQILKSAESPTINRFVRRYGKKLGAYRFVAGEDLPQALDVVRGLNSRGLLVTLDRLGEGRVDKAYAEAASQTYGEILENLGSLDASLSLKLTQLGLDLGPDLARENLTQVLRRAQALGRFVRIDMEDSAHTQATIDIFEKVHADFPDVGIVIQAYLYRSEEDLTRLGAVDASVRIVKGAYMEPREVAFPEKADVDANYRKLVALHLGGGHFTAVATHDEALIQFTKEFVQEHGIPKDRFEFQMLFGIRTRLLEDLAREGYRCRVYVPFGPDWYPYFMRRLAERPANLGFFLRALVRG